MDFELDSEHEMIRQTVHDFAEKEVRPVAAHVDKTGEFPRATVAKMGGLGFLGVAIPTAMDPIPIRPPSRILSALTNPSFSAPSIASFGT